jgi:8-oxo-dGTP pyrophosphatase MutT (NUDIX family)
VIRWRSGKVSALRQSWPEAFELDVIVDPGAGDAGGAAASAGGAGGTASGRIIRALAYPRLTGVPEPGDRVLLNTNALDLGLGTGGYALVVAIPDRLPPDQDQPGHLIKARYTPLQAAVAGVEEQGSPFHDLLRQADDLGGMPVVIADLHSALPAVLAGYLASRPGGGGDAAPAPVAYLMPDGGALPAWFSRTAATLKDAGWLAGTVTVGQAFGGDLEAVTLHSGLLAARHVLGAELAVVAQGPGNLGTGTRWGFSGVAAGEAINAASVLRGRAVGSLRISQADVRGRHAGISHHSLTAYGRVALARADIVVPELDGDFGRRLLAAAAPLAARHNLVQVSVAGLTESLRACPVPLLSMGRGFDADPAYFLAAAAAGRHAAVLAARSRADGSPDPGFDVERSCIRVVLQDSGGRVLLFRAQLASRSPAHWWELPGGGIEHGESYRQTAVRELREETGLAISPDQVGPPRWRREATWSARGLRRLQHELVVQVRLDADRPQIADGGRTAEEREEYVAARWWELAEIQASSERFYPGRLPDLLPAFLAGAELDEPFERWN